MCVCIENFGLNMLKHHETPEFSPGLPGLGQRCDGAPAPGARRWGGHHDAAAGGAVVSHHRSCPVGVSLLDSPACTLDSLDVRTLSSKSLQVQSTFFLMVYPHVHVMNTMYSAVSSAIGY